MNASLAQPIADLRAQLGKVILGKPDVIDNVIVALLGGGHILMEDVPGVGKTTLAKALALSLSAEFKRVQFTPDLLPTDILGSSVYNPRDGTFTFKEGPVFTNVLLADEINRASPRTQSSLLEAMSERQASIEGTTHPLPAPFLVIATQNPIEFHGTYPLPEAQLDRFAMRINLGYPDKQHEVDVLFSQFHHHPLEDVRPVVKAAAVLELQAAARTVKVDPTIARYIVDLADATRHHPAVKIGCSPRGALILFRIAQARAFVHGRDYAIPEDVKAVAVLTLGHRLGLDTKAKYSGIAKEDVVREILDRVAVGV
ncbi:MAG TPA: MoxR family ATPase [Vicinamibacteria bacterium]|jgi:MoxR-like ATPase|nr:MoxR family ATPase [Vicinamibacteria bacterium]